MILLSIESSDTRGSVSLSVNGVVTREWISAEEDHARSLPVFIKDASTTYTTEFTHLDGIVFSEGPGSYTGLRIGAGLAKGLCYGLSLPLYVVPTPVLLYYTFITMHSDWAHRYTTLFPMIDARRMEIYTAAFDTEKKMISPIEAIILQDENALLPLIQTYNNKLIIEKICFFGKGAEKGIGVLPKERFEYVPDIYPQSKYLSAIVENENPGGLYKKVDGREIAYYEPFYLKPYIARKSVVKGLA